MSYNEAGKGSAPRKQADQHNYALNYDKIFRKQNVCGTNGNQQHNPVPTEIQVDQAVSTQHIQMPILRGFKKESE
jgi:hypothetical protein